MEKSDGDDSNLLPPAKQAVNHWPLQTLLGFKEGVYFLPKPTLRLPRWDHRSQLGRGAGFTYSIRRMKGSHLSRKGWSPQLPLVPFFLDFSYILSLFQQFSFSWGQTQDMGPEAEGDPQRKEKPKGPVTATPSEQKFHPPRIHSLYKALWNTAHV